MHVVLFGFFSYIHFLCFSFKRALFSVGDGGGGTPLDKGPIVVDRARNPASTDSHFSSLAALAPRNAIRFRSVAELGPGTRHSGRLHGGLGLGGDPAGSDLVDLDVYPLSIMLLCLKYESALFYRKWRC